MNLNIRKGESGEWGFVESFENYRYNDKGTVTVLLVVTHEGKLSTPYVFRGGDFIPASVIHEEMGIEKYLKAKKPFYSRLSDGFIVKLKAGTDFLSGEHVPENTSYEVYQISKTVAVSVNQGRLTVRKLLEIPDKVKDLMTELAVEVAKCKGNRETFLLSRITED